VQSLEDKALKNKLDKERLARKAELNRAVVSKVERVSSPHVSKGSHGLSETRAEPRPVGSVPLSIGASVITSFGNIGTIEKLDKDTAEVLVGGMRLREKIANLQVVEARAGTATVKERVSVHKPLDAPDASAELNLIGQTTAEAEYELDRFIDEAYMASVPRVRIIHGFGTGALKNFVHHFLKNHDLVERFAFAPDSQGGNGATIAEMKT
jgi:DNA mismatch repair protein MutS2